MHDHSSLENSVACDLKVTTVSSRQDMDEFLKLPWELYQGTAWVPPLLSEVRAKLDETRNPFLKTAHLRLFAVRNGKDLIGRIAAINNPQHEREHGEKAGFFGFFECENNPEAARVLAEAAAAYLRSLGCRTMIGPVNLSTNDESGFLLNDYETRPRIMVNYCLPYYHDLMQRIGMTKAIDTVSYEAETHHPFPESYQRVLDRVLANPQVRLRRFSRRTAKQNMIEICELYNSSFRGTWGFVPLSHDEAVELGNAFLPFSDDDLVWIADYGDAPAGFILALPDINEVLATLNGRLFPFGIFRFLAHRRRLAACRIVAFGVLPEHRGLGLETALIDKVRTRILEKPYQKAEFSVVMENNERMRRLLETIGFRLHKRYRLYRKEI